MSVCEDLIDVDTLAAAAALPAPDSAPLAALPTASSEANSVDVPAQPTATAVPTTPTAPAGTPPRVAIPSAPATSRSVTRPPDESPAELLARWNRQLGTWRRYAFLPRPVAAIGYLASVSPGETLVPVDRLTFVVVHDEDLGDGNFALRVAGFSGIRVPGGVAWGLPGACRFYKDLRLRPLENACGLRLDPKKTASLSKALWLEAALQKCVAGSLRHRPRPLRLPRLWAAFQPADALDIGPDGPEIAIAAARRQTTPERLLRLATRTHGNLVLYPFDWVAHAHQQIVNVFADLWQFSGSQMVLARNPETDLVGYRGAASFDFFHNAFRRSPRTGG